MVRARTLTRSGRSGIVAALSPERHEGELKMSMRKLLVVGVAVAGLGLAGCGGDSSSNGSGNNASSGVDPTANDPTTPASSSGSSGSPDTADTADTNETNDTNDTTGQATTDEPFDPPILFDVLDDATGGAGGCQGAPNDLALQGTVWAPNGVIPVSGALVYTSAGQPDGIPQEVYCAECEELDCDDRFTTTAADGSFTLNTYAQGANYLVVQKGQFMRVTPINFGTGAETLDDELTTLPGENDPENGLFIPLIAVGNGQYDRLEDGLGKFGLGDTLIENFEERLVPGTEPFDLWDNGQDPAADGFTSQGTFAQLISSPQNLAQYHMIFAPCSTDDYVSSLTPQNVQNIRDWVAAGGRWYVSDWANEWLIEVFPEYQNLSCSGGSCDNGAYDSMADVLDDGLLEWLEAMPAPLQDINPLNDESHPTLFDLPQVQTVDNWSGIQDILPVLVDDGKGGQIDVGHKVWLQGPGGTIGGVHPLTVTGQFGCGKLQFTSYHMAEFFDYVGLSPQELVLLYTILEIGVCQEALPPPQG